MRTLGSILISLIAATGLVMPSYADDDNAIRTTLTAPGDKVNAPGGKVNAPRGGKVNAPGGTSANAPADTTTKGSASPTNKDSSGRKSRRAETQKQSKSFIIKFVTSEPCGLIDCLSTLAKHPHSSAYLREYFFDLHPLSSEEATMLDNYAKVIAAPAPKKQPKFGRVFSISDSLYDLSSQSSNTDDLLSKIQTTVSAEQFATIKTVVQHFAPIYHAMIWEPCLGDLAKQRDEFESHSTSVQMPQKLMEVQKFMTSHWSRKDPFTIALIPIPASASGKTPTSSHSFGSVQVVQVVQGQKFTQKSDIVFHELVHALWHSRSARQNRELQKKYLDPSVSGASTMDGAITLHELNEGLATAIGQGWFQSFIVHQPHYGKWCTDVQTDEFAHHLRPLAAYYIDTAMPIDNIFIQNSIANFKLGSPSPFADPNFVFNDIGIYCDSNDGKDEFKKLLYDQVPRAHNVNFHAPLNTSSSKRFFNYYKDITAVFLVSPEQLDSLKKYGIKTQVIDGVRSKTTTGDARAISILDNSRWLVFCIGKDKDSQLSAFWKALHENELQ